LPAWFEQTIRLDSILIAHHSSLITNY